MVYNIFSHLIGYLFILLIVSFDVHGLFIFSLMSIFAFVTFVFEFILVSDVKNPHNDGCQELTACVCVCV